MRFEESGLEEKKVPKPVTEWGKSRQGVDFHPDPSKTGISPENPMRRAAIESASEEELESAIEKVRGALSGEPENQALQSVLQQLEEQKAKKSTLH